MKRTLLMGLAIVVAACGSGTLSETDCVESLKAMVVDAGAKLGASLAAYGRIENPTLADFVCFVEQQLVFEYEVRDTFETFDPPE